MDSFVLETTNLTKRYGEHFVAVDSLNLSVRRGEVYGFLGPNGAGKTTTLRMLLGLVYPTSGYCKVLGRQPGTTACLSKVGALIESPAFYPYLSGRRNLLIMAKYSGIPTARVNIVLEQVDLNQQADDKFQSYSMGMKQRLGVAAALLKDPELLILDEPTNGLDPKGMADMRILIGELCKGGRTILISSHLLGEIEQICDRVGIIQNGKLFKEGTVEELRGQAKLRVRAAPFEEAKRIAKELLGSDKVQVFSDTIILTTDLAHAGEINRKLILNGITVSELMPIERSLEETYLELTGEYQHDSREKYKEE